MRCTDWSVYTAEVPGEISLGFTIPGCPVHCPECHSKHTWDADQGEKLTAKALKRAAGSQPGVSCVLFFGGEWHPDELGVLLSAVKSMGLKSALYTGRELECVKHFAFCKKLDYLKTGPYISACGPLRSKTTNQRLWKIENGIFTDITFKFWRSCILEP